MADKKPISKMNKDELEKLAKKEKVEVPEGASKTDLYDAIREARGEPPAPQSVVPPTSGPDDVHSSAVEGGPGSIDPETGETVPVSDPDSTGGDVPPAETLADGGPEPPQPTGSDEGGQKPLDQTSAPGFKTEGEVAAAKAEEKARRKAAREAEKESTAAEEPAAGSKLRIGLGQPRAENTALTIDIAGATPRASVAVALSNGRFPHGESRVTLRADAEGDAQATFYPSAGELTITARAGDDEATRTTDIAG